VTRREIKTHMEVAVIATLYLLVGTAVVLAIDWLIRGLFA